MIRHGEVRTVSTTTDSVSLRTLRRRTFQLAVRVSLLCLNSFHRVETRRRRAPSGRERSLVPPGVHGVAVGAVGVENSSPRDAPSNEPWYRQPTVDATRRTRPRDDDGRPPAILLRRSISRNTFRSSHTVHR